MASARAVADIAGLLPLRNDARRTAIALIKWQWWRMSMEFPIDVMVCRLNSPMMVQVMN